MPSSAAPTIHEMPQESSLPPAADTGAPGGVDVLILSLVFPPDGVSTAHIMGELAVDLRARGHHVRALTSTPHYGVDEQARARQPLRRVLGGLVARSTLDGVEVTHIAMPPKKAGIAKRLASWAWFHLAAALIGRRLRPKPAVIVVPSPLLSLAVVAWVINLGRRATYIYNVQELYPDLAIKSGHIRNGVLIAALRGLERFVYARAAAVTTIGRTMQRRIAARAPQRKVLVIPNAADVESMRPLPRDNDFARTHGLVGRVVVSYAGNMGLMQGLEDVLGAADILRDDSRLLFVFVGDGVQAPALRESARDRGLPNIVFLPQQPYSSMPQIYAASDICLVPLIGAIADEAIPSKVARIMACERAALAIASADSDLAQLVVAVGCGSVVSPGDPPALARAIASLAENAEVRRQMGERGRAHACTHLSRSAVAAAYDDLLRSAT